MMNRLREADCPKQPLLRLWEICVHYWFFSAKASPQIPPNRNYRSQWNGRQLSVPRAFSNFGSMSSLRKPKPENNSIPIDYGPAQFNAFYPKCSGRLFRHP